ncbi:hypothetical protein CYLTODRAFT_417665 [Cylindrobasidium torrendii FP15055 ss-10]|uniref:Hemerythrin-like domain-containing protein n=1 Tax=Cylindrobasidium torrendii FP15055 ss-10 TaxID=1314674 RepID=A0A0D7BQ17_9AGAR|nr:hypothetical protein CYLTODRAFT_417665 [Cylindrobasidium torrendii FP15055 ss-10]
MNLNLKLLTSLLIPFLGFAAFRALNHNNNNLGSNNKFTGEGNSMAVQHAMAADAAMQRSMFSDAGVLVDVDRIRTIAEVPRPASAAAKTGWAMAWMHLVIWNSWKAAYFHASAFSASTQGQDANKAQGSQGDFENYKIYAREAIKFLVDHHDAEEETLFPRLEERMPGCMKANEEQHQSFLGELGTLYTYIQTATPSTFDASVFRSQMDAILPPLMAHLASELDTLSPSLLSASSATSGFSEEELTEINLATHKSQQSRSPSNIALPLVMQSLPPGCAFPPAPGFVKSVVGPWMVYWKYRAVWKYTAYPWTWEVVVPAPQ